VTAAGSFAGGRRAGGLGRGAARLMLGLIGPIVLSALVLLYAIPSRMTGASGGITGWVARIGDQYPLLVLGFALIVLSEIGRYWSRQLFPPAAPLTVAPSRTRRLVAALAAAAVLVFVVHSSVVATYRVVGPSMLPTLEVGDRLLVDRSAYGVAVPLSKLRLGAKPPKRGDLVVFPASGMIGAPGVQMVVKRVIGLPGDRVAYAEGSVLVINNWPVPTCDAGPFVDLYGSVTVRGRLMVEVLGDKAYLTVRDMMDTPFEGYVVQPNEVFVLGDDRGISSDSRFWNEGRGAGVPLDMIEGKVTRVLAGARRDGGIDVSRLLVRPADLKVRMPGIDMQETDKRIAACLAKWPANTTPPAPGDAPPTPPPAPSVLISD